jgi:hypothetical protein
VQRPGFYPVRLRHIEMDRLFTLDEASALLEEVRPILEEIVGARARLAEAEQDLLVLHWKARGNGHASEQGSFSTGQHSRAQLVEKLNGLIARLAELGVELKDPAVGLIDFRSLRDGRVVYLCWKLGEPAIEFWHDLDAGFAGRQPL